MNATTNLIRKLRVYDKFIHLPFVAVSVCIMFPNSLVEKRATLVHEPALTMRVGYRNLKIQAYYALTTFSYNQSDYEPYNSAAFSIGVQLLISDWYKNTYGNDND